jgi:[protein-PII] uridylyltransferase
VGGAFDDSRRLGRLEKAVRSAVDGQEPSVERLEARALPLLRAEAFSIEPAVFVDNKASGRYTVVEVNARDRAALLSELAKAIFDTEATIHSAHIATYGERAVDVFYLTDRDGRKIESIFHLEAIRSSLLHAALEPGRRDSELAAE